MEKIKTANYLTILDFEEGQVFQYNIRGFNVGLEYDWSPDSESCEEFMTKKGHDITNCEWMVHRDEGVIYPIKNGNFRSGVSTSM